MTAPKDWGERGAWFQGFRVTAIEISPDGRHALTSGQQSPAQLFVAKSGERVRSFAGNTLSVARFANGGRRAAASVLVGEAMCLRFWDVTTGEIVGDRPMEPTLVCVDREADRAIVWQLNPDGFAFVSLEPSDRAEPIPFDPHPTAVHGFLRGGCVLGAEPEKGLAVWGADGRLLGSLPESPSPDMTNVYVAISPDRRRAVTATREALEIWNLDTRLRTSSLPCVGFTWSVTFFPDSVRALHVFEGPDRATVAAVLDVSTGVVGAARPFPGGSRTSSTPIGDPAQISSDGRWLIAPSSFRTAWWDIENGFSNPFQSGHMHSVLCVAMSADGAHVVATDSSGALLSWDLATGSHRNLHEWQRGAAEALAFAPDGRVLAASSGAAVWIDPATGADVRQVITVENARFASTEDAACLMVSDDTSCEIRTPPDTATPVRLEGGWTTDPELPVQRFLKGAWLSADGRTVLTVDGFLDRELGDSRPENEMRLWSAGTGEKTVGRLIDMTNSAVLGFLPVGKALIADGESRVIAVDVATGAREAPEGSLTASTTAISGSLVTLAAEVEDSVRVWDFATRTSRGTFTADSPVSTWAFAARGTKLIAAKEDGTFRMWDL